MFVYQEKWWIMIIKPLKVSELNNYIRKILYSNPILNNVTVMGEVRDLRKSKFGYQYFSLSDENSIINCVCFDPDVEIPEDKITIVKGKVETYDKRSVYQLIVQEVSEISEGVESKYLKELKAKLEKKGYFDPSRKKPLPTFPKKIGIITSIEGAVIEDIKRVYNECNVGMDILFYNAFVQGRTAVFNIVSGIKYFNEVNQCDIIILARGGGSKVDLETFNDEILADTIFKSRVPILTGIGHGTDLSVADMTADREVQTPTAAAELTIRGYNSLIGALPAYREQLNDRFMEFSSRKLYYVNLQKERLKFLNTRHFIERRQDQVTAKITNISSHYLKYINDKKYELSQLQLDLIQNDYKEICDKGFIFIRNAEGHLVKNLNSLKPDDKVSLENMQSIANAIITNVGDKNEKSNL
ncbi:MAG: exodeoxyribonuclease VII large subunit [Dethiosulfatibacter sp.]|nr:exodeoxyribonuclease VII large subunit [Dethiosulfatibacter sp.]